MHFHWLKNCSIPCGGHIVAFQSGTLPLSAVLIKIFLNRQRFHILVPRKTPLNFATFAKANAFKIHFSEEFQKCTSYLKQSSKSFVCIVWICIVLNCIAIGHSNNANQRFRTMILRPCLKCKTICSKRTKVCVGVKVVVCRCHVVHIHRLHGGHRDILRFHSRLNFSQF